MSEKCGECGAPVEKCPHCDKPIYKEPYQWKWGYWPDWTYIPSVWTPDPKPLPYTITWTTTGGSDITVYDPSPGNDVGE